MAAGTLTDAVALLITFLVAGWLAGVAIVPERLGLSTRLLLSLALGVSAAVVLAFPGVLIRQLGGASFLAALTPLALLAAFRARASLVAVTRPERRAGWWHRQRRRWSVRRGGAVRAVSLLATLGIAAAFVVLPQLGAADEHGLLRGTTPWYYYRLVLEMVGTSGIPSAIGEWGAQRPYPVEYLGTTIHTAISAMLAGGPDLRFMEGYRLALLVTGLAAAYALWRRWLPAWWAWVAALLTLLLLRTSTRFVGYRPETFGFVLVLWSAWLFDQALARRSWRWGILAGVVSAVAFNSHAEVWLITGPLWGAILVGRVAGALPGSTNRGVDPPGAGRRRSPLVRLAGVVLLALGGFAAVAAVAAAAGTGSRIADIAQQPGGVDLRAKYGGDPTWAFYAQITGFDTAEEPAPAGFWDRAMQDPATVTPWWSFSLSSLAGVGVVTSAVLLVAFAAWRGGGRIGRFALALPLYVVGIFVGSFVLWYLYDTYVPARAGPRRLLAFHAIALAGLISAAAWVIVATVTRSLHGRLPGGPARRRAVTIVGHLAALAVGALIVGWLSPPGGTLDGGKTISADGYAAMTWIHDNLPHDRVLMVNTYTDGSVGAITGMTGWTDGRAPYLEDPAWLDESIQRLRDAQRFFYDPKFIGVPDGVDYVLAGQEADLAGYFTWDDPVNEIDWAALGSYERLVVVKSFRADQLVLYRVVPGAEGG